MDCIAKNISEKQKLLKQVVGNAGVIDYLFGDIYRSAFRLNIILGKIFADYTNGEKLNAAEKGDKYNYLSKTVDSDFVNEFSNKCNDKVDDGKEG